MKIVEVTSIGITFVDNYGLTKFIDFKECNENWVMYNKRNRNWSEDQVLEFRSKSNCVGQRDICATPCFFEFFTKPFTKIEFAGFYAQKQFRDLQKKILEVGWTTFDLS